MPRSRLSSRIRSSTELPIAALRGQTAKKRLDAIKILTETGRTIDDASLKARGINPEAVLIMITELKVFLLFRQITGSFSGHSEGLFLYPLANK